MQDWRHAQPSHLQMQGFVVITTTTRRTRQDEHFGVVHLCAPPPLPGQVVIMFHLFFFGFVLVFY
jgi:hypothetical protein